MGLLTIVRDRQIEQIERGPYSLGGIVDELKQHFTPDGKQCNIRRGIITKIDNDQLQQIANIDCICGTQITESA